MLKRLEALAAVGEERFGAFSFEVDPRALGVGFNPRLERETICLTTWATNSATWLSALITGSRV